MQDRQLEILMEILSIPTFYEDDSRIRKYVSSRLDGFRIFEDETGIYASKGNAEFYPCVSAHLDTVHPICETLMPKIDESDNVLKIFGTDFQGSPSGIGGDDKCGIYLALRAFESLDCAKLALFSSEEIGCVGSSTADPSFFEDVGYAVCFDAPGIKSASRKILGRSMMESGSEFEGIASRVLGYFGISIDAEHCYSDAWEISDRFSISCINMPCGYHSNHKVCEYVVPDEVEKSFDAAISLISELGCNKYKNSCKEAPSFSISHNGSEMEFFEGIDIIRRVRDCKNFRLIYKT